jgi:DNA invertase Pin-like site-specific DNA recombinase
MAIVGYARVSTKEQSLDIQVDKLNQYGVDRIFMEKQSGGKSDREELHKALDYLREGDTLVVYKIDRLARSIRDLNNIVGDLEERGIGLIFIKENIDFTTSAGKLMFHMLGAIAEFEKDIINERTAEGREKAKAKGTHMGRKGKPTKDVEKALKLFRERDTNNLSVNEIVKMTGVPRATIYAKNREREAHEQLEEIKFLEQSDEEIKSTIEQWISEGRTFDSIKGLLSLYCGNNKEEKGRVSAICKMVMEQSIDEQLNNFVL